MPSTKIAFFAVLSSKTLETEGMLKKLTVKISFRLRARVFYEQIVNEVGSRSSRTTEDSSSRRMCLVPFFTQETDNEYLLKFVQMNNVSSSIKTATTTYITYNTHVTILALLAIRILQYNYAN